MKNLKPFDLKEALAGKAVMTRCGRKAYVRCYESDMPANQRLVGRIEGIEQWWSWCESGHYINQDSLTASDIIGMYPETRVINGFEVTAPESEKLGCHTTYYFPVLHLDDYFGEDEWYSDEDWHERLLKRGLVFLNEEDAIATAKAMLGIDPNIKEEESYE